MKELKTSFNDSQNKNVRITLHKNYMMKENDTYAKVVRQDVDMEALIALVHKSLPMVSESIIHAIAAEFKKAIEQKLREGFAVNMFDMGKLYLTAKYNPDATDGEGSGKIKLGLAFTPSDYAKQAVSALKVEETGEERREVLIKEVRDLFTNKTDGTVSAGKALEIHGQRLKIAGDDKSSGVFFAPANGEKGYNVDEKTWKKASSVYKNTPSVLSLFLPEGVESSSKWFIVIKTRYTQGGRLLKNLREGASSFALTVK